MKNLLVGILATALTVLLLFVVETRILAVPGTVYTVAQAHAGMIRQPQLWVGRTVLVRAHAFPLGTSCPPINPWYWWTARPCSPIRRHSSPWRPTRRVPTRS